MTWVPRGPESRDPPEDALNVGAPKPGHILARGWHGKLRMSAQRVYIILWFCSSLFFSLIFTAHLLYRLTMVRCNSLRLRATIRGLSARHLALPGEGCHKLLLPVGRTNG